MHFREVQVRANGDQWEAFHPDAADERIVGSSPLDAIRRLKDYRREQEEALAQYHKAHREEFTRRNSMIMAAVFVVVFALAAFYVHQTTTKTAHTPIYAHHTSLSNTER